MKKDNDERSMATGKYACEDAIKTSERGTGPFGVFVPASDEVLTAVERLGYPFRQAKRREGNFNKI